MIEEMKFHYSDSKALVEASVVYTNSADTESREYNTECKHCAALQLAQVWISSAKMGSIAHMQ